MKYRSYNELLFGKQFDKDELPFDHVWKFFSQFVSEGSQSKLRLSDVLHDVCGYRNVANMLCQLRFNLLAKDRELILDCKLQILDVGDSTCSNMKYHCDGFSSAQQLGYSLIILDESADNTGIDKNGTEFARDRLKFPAMTHFTSSLMEKLHDNITFSWDPDSGISIPTRTIINYDSTFPHRGIIVNQPTRRIFLRLHEEA